MKIENDTIAALARLPKNLSLESMEVVNQGDNRVSLGEVCETG